VVIRYCLRAAFPPSRNPRPRCRRAHERQIIDEFTRLLAIPNVAADRGNIRRNSEFIFEMMQREA
jgi:hypothetical protein